MTDEDIPYQLMSTQSWADAVRDTFQLLARGDAWDLVGSCPRCGHQTVKRLEGGGVTTYRAPGTDDRLATLVRCDCGSEHAGRPQGSRGCGAYVTVELQWS